MAQNLNFIIEQVGRDKGIDKEIIIEALESAVLTASRRKFGAQKDIEAHYNVESGEVELFQFMNVVETVEDPETEISLEEARKLDEGAEIGDSLGVKLDTSNFGRIAAQTAKQVIIQRVRDAERENIYNEFKDRKGELITGTVQRIERGNLYVNIGRAEAVLYSREQVPGESYRQGERIRAYVLDVQRTARGPMIFLSRTHPGLLVKLFEMEVPEISEGIIRIVSAAREPRERAKIAVYSRDSDVDPVGACVGMRGSRVQSVVQELRGERIDIVPYAEDPAKYVCNALSPAKVSTVYIDEENRYMEVIVPDDQLSLAIGKKGQNVRLASKLTGWKIDIKSESKMERMSEEAREALKTIPNVGDVMSRVLYNEGYRSIEDIANAEPEELARKAGISLKTVEKIVASAREMARTPEAAETAEPADQPGVSLGNLPGVGAKTVALLESHGFETVAAVARGTAGELSRIPGIGEKRAEKLIQAAWELLAQKQNG
ncbi:MAG: transcription termination/antitermination protein NusA [Deltaproteobacteria bacterium]|nr:transcription termination/antitermination protein NusA [Deltaproteobacteria bacterium]